MNMEWPVLFVESADPLSWQVIPNETELRAAVEEFWTIIDQFRAWDALGDELELRSLAPRSAGNMRHVANGGSEAISHHQAIEIVLASILAAERAHNFTVHTEGECAELKARWGSRSGHQ